MKFRPILKRFGESFVLSAAVFGFFAAENGRAGFEFFGTDFVFFGSKFVRSVLNFLGEILSFFAADFEFFAASFNMILKKVKFINAY